MTSNHQPQDNDMWDEQPPKQPTTPTVELREQLAAIEHQRWSDWQKWCHKVVRENNPSSETLKVLERWDKQIATPYEALSRKEKDSDREQVDRYMPLIAQAVREARIEMLEPLCLMYDQYCSGPSGHDFMMAGESAIEVLEEYGLTKDNFHIADDWEVRLKAIKGDNYDQPPSPELTNIKGSLCACGHNDAMHNFGHSDCNYCECRSFTSQPVSHTDLLEAKIASELKHTLKLVPSSQRELFVYELAKWYDQQVTAAKIKELDILRIKFDRIDVEQYATDRIATLTKEITNANQ